MSLSENRKFRKHRFSYVLHLKMHFYQRHTFVIPFHVELDTYRCKLDRLEVQQNISHLKAKEYVIKADTCFRKSIIVYNNKLSALLENL